MSKQIIELIASDDSAKAVSIVEKTLAKKLLHAINEKASTVAKMTYGSMFEFYGGAAEQPQYVNPNDNAYATFFANALKKFGVNGPEEFTDENTKAQFFQYVDNNWKAQDSVQGLATPPGSTLELGTQTQLPPAATQPMPPPPTMAAPPATPPVDPQMGAPMDAPMPTPPAPVAPTSGSVAQHIPPGYTLILRPADSGSSAANMPPPDDTPGAEGDDEDFDQDGQNPMMGDEDDDQDPDLNIGDEDEDDQMTDDEDDDHDDGNPFAQNGDTDEGDDEDDDQSGMDQDGQNPMMGDDEDEEDADDEDEEDADDDGFEDGNGDEDGDGIPDNEDTDANGNDVYDDQEDQDGDGVPDRMDSDRDGDGDVNADDEDPDSFENADVEDEDEIDGDHFDEDPDTDADDDENDDDDYDPDDPYHEEEDEEEEDRNPKKPFVEESVQPKRIVKTSAFPRSEDFGVVVSNTEDAIFIKEVLEPKIAQTPKTDKAGHMKLRLAKKNLASIKEARNQELTKLRKQRAVIMGDKLKSLQEKEQAKAELVALGKEKVRTYNRQARSIKKLHEGR